MPKIMEFVYVMIFFFSLFFVVTNVNGNPFFILLKFISSFCTNLLSLL